MSSLSSTAGRSFLAGCALVVLAGLMFSLGVLCIRGASGSDAWQYLFWRSLGFVPVLWFVAAQSHGTNLLSQIRRLDAFAWVSVLAQAASQFFFILAIKTGSTAEVYFLMSLAPLMAAVLAWPLLGERIGFLGTLAVTIALGGLALMSGLIGSIDGGETELRPEQWSSRFLALGTAFAFALYSLATRGARSEGLYAALVTVGIVTALVGIAAVATHRVPLVSSLRDCTLALLHGGVFLAAGFILFARASRVVPGVTLVMLAQAETVAAPIWTYLMFGEATTSSVVAGGALVLLAVVMQASVSARQTALERR